MGSQIVALALQAKAEFELAAIGVPEHAKEAGKTLGEVLSVPSKAPVMGERALKAAIRSREIQVLLDVTEAGVAEGYMRAAVDARLPFVSGTTGIPDKTLAEIARLAKKAGVPGVWTPNFSVGVNVFFAAVGHVAKALPGYEVEIVEVHHNQKKDAPSGTAKRAAEIVKRATGVEKTISGREGMVGPRGKEIGIHAVRLGDVVGDHTVYFSGNSERIEVTHRAHSRAAFAAGALVAARWVAEQKEGGLYSMADVLGIKID